MSDDRLRQLSHAVEQSPATVVITDAEGRIEYANPAFERTTGYSLAEAIGGNPRVLKSGRMPAELYENLWKTIRDGRDWHGEFQNKRKDGSLYWERAVISPVRDSAGRTTHYIAVKEEITERKRAEAELIRNEARLDTFLSLARRAPGLSERTIVQEALEHAVLLTESTIGYFHFVSEDERTLELYTWSGSVMESCTAAKPSRYPLDEAGVWADCLRTRAPVVHNDYQGLTSKRGYPEGHAHVVRHASVPVFDGGKVRMILGVGNKETPYDEADVRQLQWMGSDVWTLLSRRRTEERLRENRDLLDRMGAIQSEFILDPTDRAIFETMLEGFVALTLSAFGVIGEVHLDEDGAPYLKTFFVSNIAWNDETRVLYEAKREEGLEFRNLENMIGAVLKTGEPVLSNDVAGDPRRGGTPKGHPPIRSYLGIPFHHGGKLVGMVGVANRPGGYDAALLKELEPYLLTCANLVEAFRSERSRREAEEKVRAARDDLERAVILRTAELLDANDRLRREMAERIRTEEELHRSRRDATVGRLAATVAHQVNNPLAAIKARLDILGEDLAGTDDAQANLRVVGEQVDRIAATVRSLLGFARQRAAEAERADLGEIVRTVATLFEGSLRGRGIALEVDLPPLPAVRGEVDQIQEVFVNLLENAREALSEAGGRTVWITGRAYEEKVEVRVEDDGPGLGDDPERLFEPFFTTKGAEGTGLGLAIARRICEAAGGRLAAENRPEGGARFRVVLRT